MVPDRMNECPCSRTRPCPARARRVPVRRRLPRVQLVQEQSVRRPVRRGRPVLGRGQLSGRAPQRGVHVPRRLRGRPKNVLHPP